jgi:hypothetical protein
LADGSTDSASYQPAALKTDSSLAGSDIFSSADFVVSRYGLGRTDCADGAGGWCGGRHSALVARLGNRFFQMATLSGADSLHATQEFGYSPLTMIVIGTLAAYYAVYAMGVLRWRRSAI